MNILEPHKSEISVERISPAGQKNEWRVIFGNKNDDSKNNKIIIPEKAFQFLVDNGAYSETSNSSILQALNHTNSVYVDLRHVTITRKEEYCHITIFSDKERKFCNCTYIQLREFFWYIGNMEK